MSLPPDEIQRLLQVTLALGQYPLLCVKIRARMRREMFDRGVVSPQIFDNEVRQRAILTQEHEGLYNPFQDETADAWELRLSLVRDQLTDTYFSQHLPMELFEQITKEVLSERGVGTEYLNLAINPELAPLDLLFEQALAIEQMPHSDRTRLEARLRELKVVLIRSLISDQLGYINIAKEWFTVADLADIRRRKIGPGRIGGKAAGMLLAWRILQLTGDESLRPWITIPESFYLGSDLMYTFMSMNNLVHWNDQKYKPEDQMRAEYPQIENDYVAGRFPQDILDKLLGLLAGVGSQPLIVRSSSLLEDNFGTSFAGKYESYFCPNQGSLTENLSALTRGIAQIYATTLNPNALLYRRSRGLQDYDERMAVLIQVVQGEHSGKYFFPTVAGVGFSRNLYRWSPQIRREDGFLRMVWGLGTRAVDRVGNDYPRLVALSHPLLRPSSSPTAIRRYSQQYIDLIDLAENAYRTVPVQEVLNGHYAPLRYVALEEQEGYFSPLRSAVVEDRSRLVITFDEFLRRTPFAASMRSILMNLEKEYQTPVDVEFTASIAENGSAKPDVRINIIQCRPQSRLRDTEQVRLPSGLAEEDILFRTNFMVPQGSVNCIRYVLFVVPEGYFAIPTPDARTSLSRAIGLLNAAMARQVFICIGPGRWGTSNTDLGVFVNYGDIYNSRALVEVTGKGIGLAPEPSFGTHFFQDLMEAQIYPLAVNLDDPETTFKREFFYDTPNHLEDWLPGEERLLCCLRLIKVEDYRPGQHIDLVMDDEKSLAVAYFAPDFNPVSTTPVPPADTTQNISSTGKD